jgi:hypothetical protein
LTVASLMVRFIRSTWPLVQRMIDLGEAVLDAVLAAAHVEHVGHVSCRRPVGVSRGIAELDAIVGQHGVDLVGYRLDQATRNPKP